LFPFETARTRLQVDEGRKSVTSIRLIYELAHEEGFSTLYRGWNSLIVALTVTNFIYFYVFHGLKLYMGSTYQSQSVDKDLLFGIVAGILAVLVSNPLWVVNVRLKLQGANIKAKHVKTDYSGVIDGLFQISSREGPLALWSGVPSSLILVTNPAITYMVYEGLKRNIFDTLHLYLNSSILFFTFGAISKLCATVVTYPAQLIQARLRAGMSVSHLLTRQTLSLETCLMWFRGMESKLTQTVLNCAVMQLTYEHIIFVTRYVFELIDKLLG